MSISNISDEMNILCNEKGLYFSLMGGVPLVSRIINRNLLVDELHEMQDRFRFRKTNFETLTEIFFHSQRYESLESKSGWYLASTYDQETNTVSILLAKRFDVPYKNLVTKPLAHYDPTTRTVICYFRLT